MILLHVVADKPSNTLTPLCCLKSCSYCVPGIRALRPHFVFFSVGNCLCRLWETSVLFKDAEGSCLVWVHGVWRRMSARHVWLFIEVDINISDDGSFVVLDMSLVVILMEFTYWCRAMDRGTTGPAEVSVEKKVLSLCCSLSTALCVDTFCTLFRMTSRCFVLWSVCIILLIALEPVVLYIIRFARLVGSV